MGRLAKIGTFVGAVLSIATQVQKWAKDHPEEAAKVKAKAQEIASTQDLRGPRLLVSARRDAGLVKSSAKRGADALDLPALDLLRSDYVRLIHKVRTTRRLSDRVQREKQYDVLEQELGELRFRWLEILGHVRPQLPETD